MFSQTAEYALRAVVCLAESPEAMTARQIAEVARVPPGYMAKVLQSLSKGRIVDSQRGLGGGFQLSRPAETITLLQVVNAVDPLSRIEACPLGLAQHSSGLCPIHKKLDEAIAYVESMLSGHSIAQMLREDTANVPLGICRPSTKWTKSDGVRHVKASTRAGAKKTS